MIVTSIRVWCPGACEDEALIKFMVLALGSGLPAYGVFQLFAEQGLMLRFWATLVVFALGWWASRTFVRRNLDL